MSMWQRLIENETRIDIVEQEFKKEKIKINSLIVSMFWIILLLGGVIIYLIKTDSVPKVEETPQLYECEVTAWYAGQGYENHNIENVISWEIDKYEDEMTIEFDGGWIWINADDIDYICHTQD